MDYAVTWLMVLRLWVLCGSMGGFRIWILNDPDIFGEYDQGSLIRFLQKAVCQSIRLCSRLQKSINVKAQRIFPKLQ